MVGSVLSNTGMTTLNRDQASQAHHNDVRLPPMRGPSPQSHCSQSAGSGVLTELRDVLSLFFGQTGSGLVTVPCHG